MRRPVHIWVYDRVGFGGRVACGKKLRMSDSRVGDDIWRRGLEPDAFKRGAKWCPDCEKALGGSPVGPEEAA